MNASSHFAQRPEPARFWVRHVPEVWPSGPRRWTDLARGALGPTNGQEPADAWPPPDLSDLAYVPPGGATSVHGDALSLVQLLPGQPARPAAWLVYDLLQPLLARDLEPLESLPAGASAVWPLVAGITDDPAMWRQGLARLAAAGVRHVQPLALALEPGDRRWLADHREGTFGALFHGPVPSERSFAAVARPLGVRVFAPRPVVGVAGRAASNRALAGALALAAELWLRCGRAESEGQALFRGARWVDETDHDVTALVREGNLALVPWLAERSGALLSRLVAGGGTPLIEELEEEYAAGGAPG